MSGNDYFLKQNHTETGMENIEIKVPKVRENIPAAELEYAFNS
ncbi:MAG: hypothetical protein ACTS73_03535 [Arsenophonus sp. NEOnobi-MAG3]